MENENKKVKAIGIGIVLTAIMLISVFVVIAPAVSATEAGDLEEIRKAIEESGAEWQADHTSVSGLSLEEKQRLCGLKIRESMTMKNMIESTSSVQRSRYDESATNEMGIASIDTTVEVPKTSSLAGYNIAVVNAGSYPSNLRDQLVAWGATVDLINVPDITASLLSSYDLVWIPCCGAAGAVDAGGKAAEILSYVQNGGGEILTQPNQVMTPQCLPYTWQITDIYYGDACAATILDPTHELTAGLTVDDMPDAFDRSGTVDPAYTILALSGESEPTFGCANYGNGRVIVEMDAPLGPGICDVCGDCPPLSEAMVTRMVEWVSQRCDAFDWRDYLGGDWTTSIKDQRLCGSCWAFGSQAAMEAHIDLQEGDPTSNQDLSEQYLLNCSEGSCNGWYEDAVLNFLRDEGTVDEACMPYQATDYPDPECDHCVDCTPTEGRIWKITDWGWVAPTIPAITGHLHDAPLVTGMAVYEDFRYYDGGIYEHVWGDLLGYHLVSMVGYDECENYWICKNSWGPGWGEEGWFRIRFGQCNIESMNAYIEPPIIEPTGQPDIWVDPISFDVTLPPDTIQDYTMRIGNDGEATLTYDISDDVETTSRTLLNVKPVLEGFGNKVVEKSSEERTEVVSVTPSYNPEAPAEVALFEDSHPWGYTAIEDILSAHGISYDVYTSSQMGSVDLSPYKKVITASVQGNTFWNALEANKAWFESYVSGGGMLEMHLCAYSGSNSPGKVYPGGFVFDHTDIQYISPVDPTHPVLNTPNTITDDDLDNWNYAAHGWFDAIPAGGHIVLKSTTNDEPVWVETEFGSGSIFATTQTVEWRAGRGHPQFLENMILYMPTNGDCSWLDENPKSGSVPPGGYDEITVTIDTTCLCGEYSCDIIIANNDPDENPTIVPVSLTVPCDGGWGVRLDATCGAGTDVAEFGLNVDATDGFDPEFDEVEPPPPPGDYQQAYFYYPGNPSWCRKLSTSYIPHHFMDAAEWNSWPFQLAYSGDPSDVTIMWNAGDIAAVPPDYSLFFVVDGEWIDMRTTPSYTFSATTGTYDFEILAITAVPYTFELYTGWNMISFPVDPLDKDPDNIFGPGYYQLVTWDPVSGSYVAVDEVETGIGYWLLVTEDRSVTVLGVPLSEYYTGLIQGWNMIGSIFVDTNVPSGTETIPANQMHPSLYTWNVDHYDTTLDIDSGVGYWALAYNDCELHVFPAPPPPPAPPIPPDENNWGVKLDATCDVGTDVAEFGLNVGATDGFDPEFDEVEPPPPPCDYQQAYFYYPENPSWCRKLSTSYIPHHFMDAAEWNSWPFQLAYRGDPSGVTITWNAGDIAAVPEKYGLYFVVDGGQIDMRTTPSYTFSATTGTYDFEILLAIRIIKKPDLVIEDKWVCWPDNCTICYNVTNIGTGTAPACHNSTLYIDGVGVAHDHVPVDLAPGESYTGCFDDYTWTYTPPSDNITVCADNSETLDELDENNNCVTNIWMCGDVNRDGKVTMSDVRKVFNRYLDPNYPLDLPWAADVNCDGKVTMSDVRKVFNRYLDPGYELNCCCEEVG